MFFLISEQSTFGISDEQNVPRLHNITVKPSPDLGAESRLFSSWIDHLSRQMEQLLSVLEAHRRGLGVGM